MNHIEENLPPIPPIKAQMPPIPTQTADKEETAPLDSESQDTADKVCADKDAAGNVAADHEADCEAADNICKDHDDVMDDDESHDAEDHDVKDDDANAGITFNTGEEKDDSATRSSADTDAEKQAEQDLAHFDGLPICNEGMFTRLFSFKGRITRIEYLLSFLAFEVFATIYTLVQQVESAAGGSGCCATAVMWPCLIVTCWLITVQGVKRLHDTGRTGWLWYVPFLFIWLFFARGQKAVNRYGTPARITSSTAERKAEVRRLRRHGLWCGITWLLCPPAYLWLSMRWRIQQFLVRLLLFVGAPACVACVMALNQHNAEQQRQERAEDLAREATAKKVIGVGLDMDDIHTIVWSPDRGTSRYELTLYDDHHTRLYDDLDRLSDQPGKGWKAESLDVDTGNDDYGHYYEDYGTPPAADTPENTTWRFSGTFRQKSTGKERRVRLVIHRDDDVVYLEVR